MTKEKKSRKRRSAAEAREDILDAAELILLDRGPAELKFQSISKSVGMSLSTIHHHFGGITEIQAALIERMLAKLVDGLTDSLQHQTGEDDSSAEDAIRTAYALLGDARFAKLIAWLVLQSNITQLVDIIAPLSEIELLIATRLAKRMPTGDARKTASKIIYRVATTALGEGILGDVLKPALQPFPLDFDGAGDLISILEASDLDVDI